jgi:hypothetical protein
MCAEWFKLRFIGIVYEEGCSIPWLRAVNVGFVVDKVALKQVSLRERSVVPCHEVQPICTDISLTDSTLIQQNTVSLNSTHKLKPEH